MSDVTDSKREVKRACRKETLAQQPHTCEEVCAALNLARRPAEALIAVCTALALLHVHDGRYTLTPLAEEYFLPESPTYFGGYWDMLIANYSTYSFASVKQAILTNRPQVYGGSEWDKSHQAQAERARVFTRAMHSASMGPALAWPEVLDLSAYQHMLDIGGGSGAHCIGAVLRWPHLHATVWDLAPVYDVAAEYIAQHGLQQRIHTQVGDMWQDPYPPGALHFYGQIYHDWPPEQTQLLTQKSFASLPSGGRIILHELVYNDTKTGPFPIAAQHINMLLWTVGGQQYSGRELSAMLTAAGFTDIEVKPTFGYWSVVTGCKP